MSDFSGRTPKKLDISIQNPHFFPELNIGDMQEQYRIPSEYRENTMQAHFLTAMVEVNRLLNAYACEQYRKGHATLADVPANEYQAAIQRMTADADNLPETSTQAELVNLYKTAVYARAAAKLWEVYATANRRDQQTHDERESEEQHISYMNASDSAIQLIQGDTPAIGVRAALV